MVINKPIEMVVKFECNGNMTPHRFRYSAENEANVVIKIEDILFKEKQKIAGVEYILFKCRSVIDGIQKIYELKYMIKTCKWILYKI